MPRITLATDPTVQDIKHRFAVGVDYPLYGNLELYGEDGRMSNMSGLCVEKWKGSAAGWQKAFKPRLTEIGTCS